MTVSAVLSAARFRLSLIDAPNSSRVGARAGFPSFVLGDRFLFGLRFVVSEEAAKAFFSEALVQRITGLYGVRPSVAFVEIAAFVDNAPS